MPLADDIQVLASRTVSALDASQAIRENEQGEEGVV